MAKQRRQKSGKNTDGAAIQCKLPGLGACEDSPQSSQGAEDAIIRKDDIRRAPARIAVVYRNAPLMPMVWRRARKLLMEKKAKVRWTKYGIPYLQLKKAPSGFSTQPVAVGIDPGSNFDGFSVVSQKCHLLNLELVHTLKISERMRARAKYRRIRRSRKRHRKCKNQNRTKSWLCPTIRAKVEFRKQAMREICRLYPVTYAAVEDVRFNHYQNRWGEYFSKCEIGKNELYFYLGCMLGLEVKLVQGFETAEKRVAIFGKDLKNHKKDAKTFFAHCLDSFVIGSMCDCFDIRRLSDCQSQILLERKNWMARRELFRLKAKYKSAKDYFRYGKGGKRIVVKHMSRPRRIRVKLSDTQKSNHGPWEYMLTESRRTYRSFRSAYGGTISQGNSRSGVPEGQPKKRKPWGWQNVIFERIGQKRRNSSPA